MTDDINLALVRFMYDRLGLNGRDEPFNYLNSNFAPVEGNKPKAGNTEYVDKAVNVFCTDESVLTKEDVLEYDTNIQEHLSTINEARETPLKLRYYQYLAVFVAEYYFDALSSDSDALMENFSDFLSTGFVGDNDENPLSPTEATQMHKIAYWMATGSGKTYVAHINYLQFLHYFGQEAVDNVILVAPRENVARQHVGEFTKNGIDAARINNDEEADVLVTDFGKLDRDASGPNTVDVDDWGSDNLVLVDEGHKGVGSMGETLDTSWTELRDTLAGDGYTLEYSATYGSSIKDAEGYQEYSTSIIFDYPYGRFHSDGYGKDYKILNIEASSDQRATEEWNEARMEWLFANLLIYYRKLKHFQESPDEVAEYNIRKPLSVFVGGRVNATRNDEQATDIERVVQLFNRLVCDEEWVVKQIKRLKQDDLSFSGRGVIQSDVVTYVQNYEPRELYDDMVARLFDGVEDGSSTLEVHRMKNDEGEIGVKLAGAARYFGVITVGDDKDFVDRLSEKYDDINTREIDTFTGSLFERVDIDDSPIRFLVGSQKFAEGWDSVRPTNMGLLNLGRSKGPLTVQMFGRGVRVEGADKDGKRDPNARRKIELLETLHVFGVRASYIEEFKTSLAEERVNTNTVEVEVEVESNTPDSEQDYYRPTTEIEVAESIEATELITVYEDDKYRVSEPTLNLQTTVQQVEAGLSGITDEKTESHVEEVDILDKLKYDGESIAADVLDWSRIHSSVVQYKQDEETWPVVITEDCIKTLFERGRYTLNIEPSRLDATSIDDFRRIEDICVTIGKKWVDNAYDCLASRAEEENIHLEKADADWFEEVIPEKFRVRFTDKESVESDLEEIETLQDIDGSQLSEALLNLARHYYTPVAVSEDDDSEFIDTQLQNIHPEGINKGERRFIEELDKTLSDLPDDLDAKIEDAVALRNPSRTGIGFESADGFYPDFVIWVNTTADVQHIIFADPKGVIRGNPEKKILFGRRIRENINQSVRDDVELHSYIIARTDGDRKRQDITDAWESTLKGNGFEGEGIELLENANMYLQDGTTGGVPEKILRDALDAPDEK